MLFYFFFQPQPIAITVADDNEEMEGDATNPNMNRGGVDDGTDEEDNIPSTQPSPQQKKTPMSKVKKTTLHPPPPPSKRKAAKPLPPSDDEEDEDEGVDECD